MRTATAAKSPSRLRDDAKQKRESRPVSEPAALEVDKLYQAFRKGKAKLVSPGGDSRTLPDSLHSFLAAMIGLLNEEKALMIVQNQAKLTTIEAASLLGVSRQFLVNLLENGEIPYHLVGTHRRIYAEDLFRYRAKRDGQRRRTLGELAKAEAQEGLYGRRPADED